MVICRKKNFLQQAKSDIDKTNIYTKDPYELKYHLLIHRAKKVVEALSRKCPNTEFFLGLYFPVFGPVFSPNTEKHGPEKSPYLDSFHAVKIKLNIQIFRVMFIFHINSFKVTKNFMH